MSYTDFQTHTLDDGSLFHAGWLPAALRPSTAATFDALWDLHPDAYHRIVMAGRPVDTPRWQQAYGMDYRYTGRVNRALPVPAVYAPYLTWAQSHLDHRLNGLLLNWYDGKKGHYIGRHRDSTAGMVDGVPIVTISLGEVRAFRLRPWRQPGFIDFTAGHGAVFVLPTTTNRAWTHEIPRSKQAIGRRISLTLRAFT
ncbi:MAG: alkylated DNA repair dioxygenase AlkB [Myxococcota bacterium]|jgi:alkylated DNA repair dioxygenase AlkB